MPGAYKHNRDELKLEYLNFEGNLRQFAEEVKVPYNTILDYSSQDRCNPEIGKSWHEAQEEHRKFLAEQAMEKAKEAIGAIQADAIEFYKEFITYGREELKKGNVKVSAHELAECHKMLRLVAGEATDRGEIKHTNGLESLSDNELLSFVAEFGKGKGKARASTSDA